MSKVPVSLIVDDGGIVNMAYFHDLKVKHDLAIPVGFVRKFAGICRKNGIFFLKSVDFVNFRVYSNKC